VKNFEKVEIGVDKEETMVDRQTDYDFIRIFLTVMVVLGHCAFLEIITPFGGIFYKSGMESSGIPVSVGIRPLVSEFSNMVYSFHMPAFFALSGALFAKGYGSERWDSFPRLLKVKVARVLIPCVVVWFVYNVPLKFISGYYNDSSLCKAVLQILFPSRVYLWYLEALFLCFIFAWCIRRFFGTDAKATLIVVAAWCFGYLLQRRNDSYLLLGNPCKYLLWFWLGMNVDSFIVKIKETLDHRFKVGCMIGPFLWVLLYLLIIKCVGTHVSLWRETILPFTAVIVIWMDTVCLVECIKLSDKARKAVEIISSYCYGVYLYAEPWNYVILWAMMEIGGLSILGTPEGALIEFLLRSVGTTILAVAITWILKKGKFRIKAY